MGSPRLDPQAYVDSRRRQFLSRGAMGFGGLALASLLQGRSPAASPWLPRPPHFAPRARSVIFLYMDGGVSQVDSFDPKPRLARENGQRPKFEIDATVFNSNGNILRSPWEFKRHGESGIPVREATFENGQPKCFTIYDTQGNVTKEGCF